MAGLLFIYGYNIVSAIMRGMGDSKRPFMFVAIASVINIVLDILFVAVLRMEVIGAALATVIGQAVSFIFAMIYFYKHKDSFGFDFKLRSFIPQMDTVRKLCALGIPMAIQSAAITISMTVVAAWVNSFGVVASACAGVLNKLNMMVYIVVLVAFPEAMVGLFTTDEAILASAAIIILPSVVNAFGAVTRTFAFAIINGSGKWKK